MGLVFLVVCCSILLATPTTTSLGETSTHNKCSTQFQEDHHQVNKSGIHLTLHHVHGPCSPLASTPLPFADILARDELRVQILNSRLTKTGASTSSTSKSGDPRQKSVSIPLNPGMSIGTGNYYVKIGLGTPAKYYSMIVDTGSAFSWLQCQPCELYCHRQVGPIFDPSASKTHSYMSCDTSECSGLEAATLNSPGCTQSNKCLYQASYGDSSYSVGYLSKDTLTLSPSETLPGFVYGCGEDNEGLFGQSSGLIGLSRNKLSMLAQLSTKYGYVFSYCLPSATSASAGTLSIGRLSYNPSIYKFTPMITDPRDPSLYFIRLIAITVAGKPLTVSAVQYRTSTIIDSGTVITRLPMTVYTSFQEAFKKTMSKYAGAPSYSILDTCYKGSSKGMIVPEVRMIFQGGADLKLETQNLLIDVDNGVTCLAFAGNSGTGGVSIIGNRQQVTFKVAYDVSNSRIGFAGGGCR